MLTQNLVRFPAQCPSKRIKKEDEQAAQAGDREATPMPMPVPITQAVDHPGGVDTSVQQGSGTEESPLQQQQQESLMAAVSGRMTTLHHAEAQD